MKISRLQLGWPALLIMILSIQLQSCKPKVKDADIQSAISAKTQSDPSLAGVNASVMNGVVTLSGQCNDAPCKTNAEQAVKDIKGVKSVVNNITVAPVVITPDDPLKSSVDQVISKYPGVQADVMAGVVTLKGEIARDKLQSLMMDVNALHPKNVENQLVVK